MLKVICELIIMSVSGTVMYALSLLFKGRKHAASRYAMLIAAAVIMLIPFGAIDIAPKMLNIELMRETVSGAGYAVQTQTGVSFSDIAVAAVFFIWLTGAAVTGIGIIRDYIKTAHVIKRVSEKTLDGRIIGIYKSVCGLLSVRQGVSIYVSRHLRSPLLFGVIRPKIVIPEREFTDAELEMIMAHELVHYKHRDLWIALAAAAVRCVHWFNPCAYMLGAAITETRELCCDETVLAMMEPHDKKEYGRVIISVIEDGINGGLAYTTAMASPKKCIKKRLVKIAYFKKPSRIVRIAGMAAVCACSAVSLTAFGFTQAAEAVPTEITHRMAEAIAPQSVPEPTTEPETEEAAAPVETEMPQATETAPAEQITTEEPAAAEEPESEAGAGYVTEEAEPEVYTFEIEADAPEPEDVVTEEPEPPAAAETDEPKTFVLPDAAYIFTPDLSGGVEVRSDNFYAAEDIKLSVSRSSDLTVRLYDADGDRLIYEDSGSSYRNSFSLDMPAGSTYYVTVLPGEDKAMSVYIRAI